MRFSRLWMRAMIQGEEKRVRTTGRGTRSSGEFGQGGDHLGSNNNGRSNPANDRECFVGGVRFPIHHQISGDRGRASRVTDLAVNIDGAVLGVVANEFAHLRELRLDGSG